MKEKNFLVENLWRTKKPFEGFFLLALRSNKLPKTLEVGMKPLNLCRALLSRVDDDVVKGKKSNEKEFRSRSLLVFL